LGICNSSICLMLIYWTFNSIVQGLSWKVFHCLSSKNKLPTFMVLKWSFPCLQKHTIWPCPEQTLFSPHPHTPFL
jgi:hypothetical protein